MNEALILWRNRRGEVSPLRIATLAVLLFPAVLAGIDWARDSLGGRPLNEVIHRTGWWALVFALASLAVTPLRRTGRFAKLIDVRRMIGVAAGLYAVAHLVLFVADLRFDLVKVAVEIVSRLYLAVGFVALLILVALTATSNDTAVRAMGGMRWRRVHQAAYLATLLALVHFFQQTKADVTVPTLYAGLFAWLMGYRVLASRRGDAALGPAPLAGLAVAAAFTTFAGEAIGIGIQFGQPLGEFLPLYAATLFDPGLGIRPGWWVLVAGFAIVALDAVRNRLMAPRTVPHRVRSASAP